MNKTIYACGCYTIKDGAANNNYQYCRKHEAENDTSDSVDAAITNIEALGETVVTVALAQGKRRTYI